MESDLELPLYHLSDEDAGVLFKMILIYVNEGEGAPKDHKLNDLFQVVKTKIEFEKFRG
ncbi:MAG: hypothetical protein KJO69_02265 [Gammaproteobacteria bacterium]|nr:hypothetical protein [Gammaproteobacteria bacterium]